MLVPLDRWMKGPFRVESVKKPTKPQPKWVFDSLCLSCKRFCKAPNFNTEVWRASAFQGYCKERLLKVLWTFKLIILLFALKPEKQWKPKNVFSNELSPDHFAELNARWLTKYSPYTFRNSFLKDEEILKWLGGLVWKMWNFQKGHGMQGMLVRTRTLGDWTQN